MPGEEEIVPQGQALPLTQAERLTVQFYEWERRGRGWQVWEYPVELEPPFRPLLFHYAVPGPAVDDARKPTVLSSLVDGIFGKRPPPAPALPDPSIYEAPESTPELFFAGEPLVEFHVALPSGTKISKDAAERVLVNLTYASSPIAFEVVGTEGAIVTQFACLEPDRAQLAQQLLAHFPEATITEHDQFLEGLWDEQKASVIVDFGLSRECMLPIRTFRSFDVDPLIGIAGALADLRTGELGLLQVLFKAARHPWAESMMRAVTDNDGRAFLADAPEMVSLTREKIAQPLFAAVTRVAAFSDTETRAWTIAKAIGGALMQFANRAGNEFIPLTNDEYEDNDYAEDVRARRSRRSGMLLNLDELASLAHLPSASVRVPQLKRQERVHARRKHLCRAYGDRDLERRPADAALLSDRGVRYRQVRAAPQHDPAGHRERRRHCGARSPRRLDR